MACDHKQDSACPFACTEKSEMIQNYGCLPTRHDVMVMRVVHNKTWACHEDISKPCTGAIKELQYLGYPYKVVDKALVTEACDWAKYCEGALPVAPRTISAI